MKETTKNDTQKTKTKETKQNGPFYATIAVVLVIFMFLYIPSGPLKTYNRAYARVVDLRAKLKLAQTTKDVEEARLRGQEELRKRLHERKPDFDLWSFLNTALTETKLKDRANLENYKPRADRKGAQSDAVMVQMTITDTSLSDLIDLAHKIYSSNNLIAMYRLEYLRPTKNAKGLDCKVIWLTPKPENSQPTNP